MSARYLNSPVADSTPEHSGTHAGATVKTSSRALESSSYGRVQKPLRSSRKPLYSIRALLAFVLLAVFGATSAAPAFAAFSGSDTSGSGVIETSNSANSPEANMFCSGIGWQMNNPGGANASGGAGFGSEPILPNATNRKWTINEAYGSGLGFTQWNGTGDDVFFSGVHTGGASGNSEDEGSGQASDLGTALLEKGNASSQAHMLEPTGAGCVMAFATSGIPGMLLGFSSFIVDFAILIAGFAFDPNFICRNPANPQGTCINMLGILAGSGGSGDGVIGALTNSIYFPLLAVAFLMVAMSLVWTGIIKREFRKSFQNILWSLGAMVLGVVFLMNPMIVAGLPQQITTLATGCIVGALNGDNCFTGNSASSGSMSDDISSEGGRECTSRAAGTSMNQNIQMSINSLGCSVYKAFVLNAWSQAQFGRGYDAMAVNDPRTSAAISEAGLSGSDFRASLFSARSHNQHLNQNYRISANPYAYRMSENNSANNYVQNVAAYQLALGSSTHNPLGQGSNLNNIPAMESQGNREYDSRWFNVAVVTANDPEMWDSWASGGVHRGGAATLGVITALLGTLVIFVASAFALVYLVTSVLLTAFAPLFFLFAIEPTRGKRMFFGWLESLGSNILKYIASAFFLIVTLVLFSAVLSTAESITTALIFVLIMTAALLMYRKTLVEMIGRVNMGGEKMQSQAMDRMKQRFNIEDPNSAIRKMNAAAIGGFAGGGLAGASANYKDRRDAGQSRIGSLVKAQGAGLKHSVLGSGDAMGRQMQAGTGVIGDAFREVGRRGDKIDATKQRLAGEEQRTAEQQSKELQRIAADSAQDARTASETISEDDDYQDAHKSLNGLDENGNQAVNVDSNRNERNQMDAYEHAEEAAHVATEREVEQDELKKVQASSADPEEKKAITDEVALKLDVENMQLERGTLQQSLKEAQRAGDGDAVNRIENQLNINAEQMSEVKHDLSDLRGGEHAGAIAAFRGGIDSRLQAKGKDENDAYEYMEGGHFSEHFIADKARIQSAALRLNGNQNVLDQAQAIEKHIDDRVEAHTSGRYKDILAKSILDYQKTHNGADPGEKALEKMMKSANLEAGKSGAEKRVELEAYYGDKTRNGLKAIEEAAAAGGENAKVEGYRVNAAERLGNHNVQSGKTWVGEDGATYAVTRPNEDGSRGILRKGKYDDAFSATPLTADTSDFGEQGNQYSSKEEFFEEMAERDDLARHRRGIADPGLSAAGQAASSSNASGDPSVSGSADPTPRSSGSGSGGIGGAASSVPPVTPRATADPRRTGGIPTGDPKASAASSASVQRSSDQIAEEFGIDPETGDPVESRSSASSSASSPSSSAPTSSSSERSRNADRLRNAVNEDDFDRAMGGGLPGASSGGIGNAPAASSASTPSSGGGLGDAMRGSESTPAENTKSSGESNSAPTSERSKNTSGLGGALPERKNSDSTGNKPKGDDEKGGDDDPRPSGGVPTPKPPTGPKSPSGGAAEAPKGNPRGGLGGAMDPGASESRSGAGGGTTAAPRTGVRNTSAGAPPGATSASQGSSRPQAPSQGPSSRASAIAKKMREGNLSTEEADSFLRATQGNSEGGMSQLREEIEKNYGSAAVERSRFIDRNTEDIADGAVIRDIPKVTPVRTPRRNPGNNSEKGKERGDG